MHFISSIPFAFSFWILLQRIQTFVAAIEQELNAQTSQLSPGYDFDGYSMSYEQNQNNPWIATNQVLGNDFSQQNISPNGDWKVPDLGTNQLEHEFQNQNQNQNQNHNYQYEDNFVPSAIDTTYNTVPNGNFDTMQNDALFAQNNNQIISAMNNEAENNNQQVNALHSDTMPISKHTEIAKSVYPTVKQIHVPVQRPVNINIPQSVLVPVSHSYPVHIPIVKPVVTPYIKEITIPIEKVIPFAVIKKVPYTVEKHVPYRVEKFITVHKKVPYPIRVPVVKTIIHRPKHGYQYNRDHHGWY